VTTGSEKFKFPVFLNTIQSLLAVCTGLSYLFLSTPAGSKTPSIFPSSAITVPLVAIAFTSSLASPFGYASLAHIDYITFLLAKSCKLLPVMALHITLFRRKYPWHKYLVVLSVTAGVALFTLHASSAKAHKSKTHTVEKNRSWGLLLLGINLLLDGLTNATQDHIFKSFKYSGPQMMCATNILSTALTTGWLLLSPFLASTPVGAWLGLDLSAAAGSGGEFSAALAFLTRHPQAWIDVLGFCACGAVGQLFIFYTLSHFDSVLLVTVTVTRKMITMVLSVLWFGHALTTGQWAGVALVFGGVGAEGWMARREKKAKESGRKAASKKEI
jgi:UDP-galactose transporter B1